MLAELSRVAGASRLQRTFGDVTRVLPWVTYLTVGEFVTFANELASVMTTVQASGDPALLHDFLARWHSTADAAALRATGSGMPAGTTSVAPEPPAMTAAELDQLIEQEAQRLVGCSTAEAYERIDRGDLAGTLAEDELRLLRALRAKE